jgi:hypothetical protein
LRSVARSRPWITWLTWSSNDGLAWRTPLRAKRR